MANIKFSKVFKNSFPLNKLQTIVDYYHLTRRKNGRKYLDEFDTHWEQKWVAVELLDLIEEDRKQILDVGAGIGLFAWICVTLGHKVDITELPVDNKYQPADIINFFDDARKSFNLDETVSTYRWEISCTDYKFPSKKKYDLITMQRTNFDIGWNTDDYTRWITNCLISGLVPDGKIFWVCPWKKSNMLRSACEQGKIKYLQHQLGDLGTEYNIFEIYNNK